MNEEKSVFPGELDLSVAESKGQGNTPVDDPTFLHQTVTEGLANTKPGDVFGVKAGELEVVASETPKEKSRLFHMDEAPFIPDVTKVHNHSQAGQIGKEFELDSASELVDAEKPPIEHPVVSITVNQEENTVTATYGGKTLIERNPGDWFVQGAFQVNRVALRAAWKTKFKESLPTEFQTSFSFNGGFSMGGKRSLFTAPPARPKRVSKHASGQSKKKKRK